MRRWAHGLAEEAESRHGEAPIWRAILDGPDPLLGERALDPDVDVADTQGRFDVRVPADVAEAVLTTLAERYHGGANDGLLTALAMAVTRWRTDRGTDEGIAASTLLSLEGHGREETAVPGADLGRTVGWFTSLFPVRLDLTGVDLDDAFAGGHHAGAAVKRVKEQLRAIPDHGVGFGQLRYLTASSPKPPPRRSGSTTSAAPPSARPVRGCPPPTSRRWARPRTPPWRCRRCSTSTPSPTRPAS